LVVDTVTEATFEIVAIALAMLMIALTMGLWVNYEPDWCRRVQRFCEGDIQTERESDLCMYIDRDDQLDCRAGYRMLTEDQGR